MDEPDDEGMPRWVKVSGILLALLVVAFVVLHLTGNGLRGHA
jgi:hypothetical protein